MYGIDMVFALVILKKVVLNRNHCIVFIRVEGFNIQELACARLLIFCMVPSSASGTKYSVVEALETIEGALIY